MLDGSERTELAWHGIIAASGKSLYQEVALVYRRREEGTVIVARKTEPQIVSFPSGGSRRRNGRYCGSSAGFISRDSRATREQHSSGTGDSTNHAGDPSGEWSDTYCRDRSSCNPA